MQRIKIKSLKVFLGEQAIQLKNKAMSTGQHIPMELSQQEQRAYVHFSPTHHMVVNLNQLGMYEYEIDDGSSVLLVANTQPKQEFGEQS